MIIPDMLTVFFDTLSELDIQLIDYYRDSFSTLSSFLEDTPNNLALKRLAACKVNMRLTKYGQGIIEFSPSLASSGGKHNFNRLDKLQYQEQLAKVAELVAAYGITKNLLWGKTSRLHCATDCTPPCFFKAYVMDLKLLDFSGKYVKQVGRTYYYNAGEAKIAIYDKRKECGFKGYPVPPEFGDKNIMRWEYRVESARKFRAFGGFSLVRDSHKALEIIEERFIKEVKHAFHA